MNSDSSLDIRLDPNNNSNLSKGEYEISFYAYGKTWHNRSEKLKS